MEEGNDEENLRTSEYSQSSCLQSYMSVSIEPPHGAASPGEVYKPCSSWAIHNIVSSSPLSSCFTAIAYLGVVVNCGGEAYDWAWSYELCEVGRCPGRSGQDPHTARGKTEEHRQSNRINQLTDGCTYSPCRPSCEKWGSCGGASARGTDANAPAAAESYGVGLEGAIVR